jgi:hypothetical protein
MGGPWSYPTKMVKSRLQAERLEAYICERLERWDRRGLRRV